MSLMIIALTGTPGTGKTSIAKQLDNYKTIDLTKFVKQRELGEKQDEFEVDIDTMVDALEDEVNPEENTLIDGHLSHHFPADFCVVLRCKPEELRKRLSQRDYPEEKIDENIESEILDVVLSEAANSQDNIIEVDTTDRKAEDIAKEIENRIKEKNTGYGEIDWTEYL